MKKIMFLLLLFAMLFMSGCTLKKPLSFGCCQLDDPNSASPRCTALNGQITPGATLDSSRNCDKALGTCEVRIQLTYLDGNGRMVTEFAKTTITNPDGTTSASEWIPVPICSMPATACISGDCQAQACGAYKYIPTPIPSYSDFLTFKNNDAKTGTIKGSNAITEGTPQGIYGTKCQLVKTTEDLPIFLRRAKGAFVNTMRFGVGGSFQEFENYRMMFPFSDIYCNVNPYDGTKERYQNYLLTPEEFQEKIRNQDEFANKVEGDTSTISFDLPWKRVEAPNYCPNTGVSPFLSGTYDGGTLNGGTLPNYKFSLRTINESTVASGAAGAWTYTKLRDFNYYEMDKKFYLNFLRIMYDNELGVGLNTEAGPLPAPFECTNSLECGSGNCNFQDYLRAVCYVSEENKWVPCQCMQESRACFGGKIYLQYLNNKKPQSAADLRQHFDAYVNGVSVDGTLQGIEYYKKVSMPIELNEISINPDCTLTGSATGGLDSVDVSNTECIIEDVTKGVAICAASGQNLDLRYKISCKPRTGNVLTAPEGNYAEAENTTIYRSASFVDAVAERINADKAAAAHSALVYLARSYSFKPSHTAIPAPKPSTSLNRTGKSVSFQAAPPLACGDALCDVSETYFTCPADCPAVAGNGVCESPAERYPTDGCAPVCGQFGCEAPAETWQTCLGDCPIPDNFAPAGSITTDTLGVASGTATDADFAASPFNIRVSIDGASVGTLTAADVWFWIPAQYRNNAAHTISIASYGVNAAGGGPPNTKFGEVTLGSASFTLASTIGNLDSVDAAGIARGWAADINSPNSPVSIHFYFDGPSGTGIDGNRDGLELADRSRPDVAAATRNNFGPNHGFTYVIPNTFQDGNSHTVYAYGVDASGIEYPLYSSPITFTISPQPAGAYECKELGYEKGKPFEIEKPKTDPGPPQVTIVPTAYCDFDSTIGQMACDWKVSNGIDRKTYNDCTKKDTPPPFADGAPRYFCGQSGLTIPPGETKTIQLGRKVDLFSSNIKFFGKSIAQGAIGWSELTEQNFRNTDFFEKCKLTKDNYLVIPYDSSTPGVLGPNYPTSGNVPNQDCGYVTDATGKGCEFHVDRSGSPWFATGGMWKLPDPFNGIDELNFFIQGWYEYRRGECNTFDDDYTYGLIVKNIIFVKPNTDNPDKVGICDLDTNTKIPRSKGYGWCEGCSYSTLAKQAITSPPQAYSSVDRRVYNGYTGGMNNSDSGKVCTPIRDASGTTRLYCPTTDDSASISGNTSYPFNYFKTFPDATYLQEKQQEFLKQNIFPVIDLTQDSSWSGSVNNPSALNVPGSIINNGPQILVVDNITSAASTFQKTQKRLQLARALCPSCLLSVRFLVNSRAGGSGMGTRLNTLLEEIGAFSGYSTGAAMAYVDVVAFEFYPNEVTVEYPNLCSASAASATVTNNDNRNEYTRYYLEQMSRMISTYYGKVSLADPFTILPGSSCTLWNQDWIQETMSYLFIKQKTLSRAGLMGMLWSDTSSTFAPAIAVAQNAFCPVVKGSFNLVADEPITVYSKIYVQEQAAALCAVCSDLDITLGKCSRTCATGVECAVPSNADLDAARQQLGIPAGVDVPLKCPPNTLPVTSGQQCRQCALVPAGEQVTCKRFEADGTFKSSVYNVNELNEINPEIISSLPVANLCCLNDENGDYTYLKQVSSGKINGPVIFSRSGDPTQDCGVADYGSINPQLCGISAPVKNYRIECTGN